MNVLHITPSSNGYKQVKLLANRVSSTNHLAVIESENKEQFITGGFIISDTPEIRTVLDTIQKDKQYDFVKDFKIVPFVKAHFEIES